MTLFQIDFQVPLHSFIKLVMIFVSVAVFVLGLIAISIIVSSTNNLTVAVILSGMSLMYKKKYAGTKYRTLWDSWCYRDFKGGLTLYYDPLGSVAYKSFNPGICFSLDAIVMEFFN